jgi:hypothetical protein
VLTSNLGRLLTAWQKNIHHLELTIMITPRYRDPTSDYSSSALGRLELPKLTELDLHVETEPDAQFTRDLVRQCSSTLDNLNVKARDYSGVKTILEMVPSTLRHLAFSEFNSEPTDVDLDIKLPKMVHLQSLQLTNSGYSNFLFVTSLPLLRALEMKYIVNPADEDGMEITYQLIRKKLADLETRLKGLSKLKSLTIQSNFAKLAHSFGDLPIAETCKKLGIDYQVELLRFD